MPAASSAIASARLAVVRDVDDVAVLLEQALEDAGEALVVLDDEQVHRLSPPYVTFVRSAALAGPWLVIICALFVGRPRAGRGRGPTMPRVPEKQMRRL